MSTSVCHSFHLNGVAKPAVSPLQTARQEVPLWSPCGRTRGCSARYRSRRVKARRPFFLAGWPAWQGERRPSGREEGCPGLQGPRTERSSGLLRRRSQAVQLPVVQAFPVLEVVVQVLHEIGEVCESCRDNKRSFVFQISIHSAIRLSL